MRPAINWPIGKYVPAVDPVTIWKEIRAGSVSAEVRLKAMSAAARTRTPKPAPTQIPARRKLMPEIHPIFASGIGPSDVHGPTMFAALFPAGGLRATLSLRSEERRVG